MRARGDGSMQPEHACEHGVLSSAAAPNCPRAAVYGNLIHSCTTDRSDARARPRALARLTSFRAVAKIPPGTVHNPTSPEPCLLRQVQRPRWTQLHRRH